MKLIHVLSCLCILSFALAETGAENYSQYYNPLPEFTSDLYSDYHSPNNTLKKHVLFVSIPLPGHVNPLLAQAVELADQGFTVTIATPDTLQDYITKVKDERIHYMPVGHCTRRASTANQLFTACVKEPSFRVTSEMIFQWIQALHPCMAAGLTSLFSLSLLSLTPFPLPTAIVADITTTAAMEVADTFSIPFAVNNADLAYVISTSVAGSNPVEPIMFSGGTRLSLHSYLRPHWSTIGSDHGVRVRGDLSSLSPYPSSSSSLSPHSLNMPFAAHVYPSYPEPTTHTLHATSSSPSSSLLASLSSSLSPSILARAANALGRLLSPLVVDAILTKPLQKERQSYAPYLPALQQHLLEYAQKSGKIISQPEILNQISQLISHLHTHVNTPIDVFQLLANTLIIQNTIPGIEPPRSYPPNVHFVGPCMQKSQMPSSKLLSLVRDGNLDDIGESNQDIPVDVKWLLQMPSPSPSSSSSSSPSSSSSCSSSSFTSPPTIYISMGTLARLNIPQTHAMLHAVVQLASPKHSTGPHPTGTGSQANIGTGSSLPSTPPPTGVRTLWKASAEEQEQIACSAVRQCVALDTLGMQAGVEEVQRRLRSVAANGTREKGEEGNKDHDSGVDSGVGAGGGVGAHVGDAGAVDVLSPILSGFYHNTAPELSLRCVPGRGYHRDGYAVLKQKKSNGFGIRVVDCGNMFQKNNITVATEAKEHDNNDRTSISGKMSSSNFSAMQIIPESMVLILPWVSSQYALFSSGKIQIFLSHCGINSIFEAAQSGKVSIFCIPMFGDQWDAAVRVRDSGLGSFMDKMVLTEVGTSLLNAEISEFHTDVRNLSENVPEKTENNPKTSSPAPLYLSLPHTRVGVYDSVMSLLQMVHNRVWQHRREGLAEYARSFTGAPMAAALIRSLALYAQQGYPQILHTERGIPVVTTYTLPDDYIHRAHAQHHVDVNITEAPQEGLITSDGAKINIAGVQVIAGKVFFPPLAPGSRCALWGASVHCLQMQPTLTWMEEYYGDVLVGIIILWLCKWIFMYIMRKLYGVMGYCCRRTYREENVEKKKTD